MKQFLLEIFNLLNEDTVRPVKFASTYVSKKNKKTGLTYAQTYLKISGMNNIDKTTLINSFSAKQDMFSPGIVYYTLQPENALPFLNGAIFSKIYTYLSKTGKYTLPDVNIIKQDVIDTKYDKTLSGSAPEVSKQTDDYADMFGKILSSLNDPRTQELLQKISGIGFDINEKVYGIVKSPGNAMRAYATKPDASFVSTRIGWKNIHNRMLLPNATPIYLLYPKSNKTDYKKGEAALGVSYNDIKDNRHKMDAMRIASTVVDNSTSFLYIAFFDISDTVLIPGEEDTWNGQAGLVDNLRGVLNQFAQDELGQSNSAKDELGLTQDDNKNKTFFDKFISFLEKTKALERTTFDHIKQLDVTKDESVVTALRVFFENKSFAREHNPNIKMAKVNASIAATLTIENLAESQKLMIIKRHEKTIGDMLSKRKDWLDISLPVFQVSKALRKGFNESEDLNEGEEVGMSPEEIMQLFNVDPSTIEGSNAPSNDVENQTIKEGFYKLLNKL